MLKPIILRLIASKVLPETAASVDGNEAIRHCCMQLDVALDPRDVVLSSLP